MADNKTSIIISAENQTGKAFSDMLKGLRDVGDSAEKAQNKLGQVGMSAKATTAAMRGVPAQFTDIVTSLQGGQAPLTVLLQQGGQLKDMFGGVGEAAGALSTYAVGLVNPLSLAAAATAALGLASYQGAKESDAYSLALINTGRAAGLTVGQLSDMARRIGSTSNATVGAAAESLAVFAANGNIAADKIEQFSSVAARMKSEVGVALADTAKQFEALGKDPVTAALKLNEATRFLTMSAYEQIKAATEQGDTSKAAGIAQDAYAQTTIARLDEVKDRLGYLGKAWDNVIIAAKKGWDSFAGIGRAQGDAEKVASLARDIAGKESTIASLKGGGGGIIDQWRIDSARNELAALKEQLPVLQEKIRLDQAGAAATAKNAASVQAAAKWDADGEKYKAKSVKLAEAEAKARIEGAKAGKTQEEIEKRILALRTEYADKVSKGGGGAKKQSDEYAELFSRSAQMTSITKELDAELKGINKTHEEYAKTIEAALAPLEKEAANLEAQLTNYGLSRSEIEASTIAKLDEARATEMLNGGSAETIANLDRELAARKRIQEASLGIEGKKQAEEWQKASDRAAKKAADDWEKTSDKIGDSITDALMRGFESGKGFAENLRDTVENMFKTMVLQPVIKATVMGGLSVLGMSGAQAADGGSGSASSYLSAGSNAYSLYNGGMGGLYTDFATSGIGSALGLSTGLSTSLGVAGGAGSVMGGSAALAAAEATSSGAMGLTGIGSAIGTALPWIGGAIAIGSMLGLFDGEKPPSSAASVTSNYKNGQYTFLGQDSGQGDDFSAANAAPAAAIGKQFSTTMGGLFDSLGKELDLTFTSQLHSRGDGKQYAGFEGEINGNKINAMPMTFGNVSIEEATQKALEFAMGEGMSQAIISSDLELPFRKLFVDLLDPDLVQGMVTNLSGVANAQEKLNDVWGMSVVQAAEAALATGATQEGLVATVANMNAVVGTMMTQGDQASAMYKALSESFADLSKAQYPKTLKEYDAAMKAVDKTTTEGLKTFADLLSLRTDFAAFTAAVDTLRGQVDTSMLEYRTPDQVTAYRQTALDKAAALAGVAAPKTAADLIALADSIDYTSKAGIDLAINLPGVISAFKDLNGTLASSAAAATSQREALQAALDEALGNSAVIRASAMAKIDPSNQPLQQQIWDVEDGKAAADAAFAALSRSVEAQKSAADSAYASQTQALQNQSAATKEAYAAQANAANDALQAITSMADALKNALDSVQVQSDALDRSRRAAAAMLLNTASVEAKAGKSLADYPGLTDALAVVAKPSTQLYGSFVDYARDQGRIAATVSNLSLAAEAQKTDAQKYVDAIAKASAQVDSGFANQESYLTAQHDATIAALDKQLADGQAQIDALNGVDTSVLSVAESLRLLSDAIFALKQGFPDLNNKAVSPTVSANSVQGLYQSLLGRNADISGLNRYTNLMLGGTTLAEVEAEIRASEEYKRNSHASGLVRVPYNGYKATLHKDETVIDAPATAAISRYFGGSPSQQSNAETNKKLDSLAADVRAGQAQIAANTSRLNRFFDQVCPDGDALAVRIAA